MACKVNMFSFDFQVEASQRKKFAVAPPGSRHHLLMSHVRTILKLLSLKPLQNLGGTDCYRERKRDLKKFKSHVFYRNEPPLKKCMQESLCFVIMCNGVDITITSPQLKAPKGRYF